MQVLDNILIKMTDFLFGPYILVVFFGTGLYLTIRTKGIQFRKFGLAMRTMFPASSGMTLTVRSDPSGLSPLHCRPVSA